MEPAEGNTVSVAWVVCLYKTCLTELISIAAIDDSYVEPTTTVPLHLAASSSDQSYDGITSQMTATLLDNDHADVIVEGQVARLSSKPRADVVITGGGIREIRVLPDEWFQWQLLEVVQEDGSGPLRAKSSDLTFSFDATPVEARPSYVTLEVSKGGPGHHRVRLRGEPFHHMRIRVELDLANQYCFEDYGVVKQPNFWRPCLRGDPCDCQNVGPLHLNASRIDVGYENFSVPIDVAIGRVDTFARAPAALAVIYRLYVEDALVDVQRLQADEPNLSARASVVFQGKQVVFVDENGPYQVFASPYRPQLSVRLGTKPWTDVVVTIGSQRLIFAVEMWDQLQRVSVDVDSTIKLDLDSLDASYSGTEVVVSLLPVENIRDNTHEESFLFGIEQEETTYNASMMVLQRTMMMSTYVGLTVFMLLILYRVLGPSSQSSLGSIQSKSAVAVKEPLLRAKFAALFLRPAPSVNELKEGSRVIVRYVSKGNVEYHRGKVAAKQSKYRKGLYLGVAFDDGDQDDRVDISDVREFY